MTAALKGALAAREDPALPAVAAFLDFDAFGVLPRAGGVRDQDPVIMDGLRLCLNIKREHEAAQLKAERKNTR